MRPFPDIGGGQWQISTMGGNEPSWSRDGRELFYRAPDGALMRVAVENGSAWKAGSPTRLLQGGYYEGDTATSVVGVALRTYDISPDGRRFVMIKDGPVAVEAGQTARIIVVENWFEELKRRVPVNYELNARLAA